MVRRFIVALLFAPAAVHAAGGDIELDRANIDSGDVLSIQHGAKVFVNYCLNCHSATAMRYNRLMDLGLTEQQIRDNLLFTGEKVGDPMHIAASRKDQREWFGVAPPDLSVIARARSVDWLYTYMRSFYRDPARVSGWNNLAFPDVAMPHVLWQLQGTQVLKFEIEDRGGHKVEHKKLVLESPGTLAPPEYDELARDLVNYLSYMGEPVKTRRVQIGIVVLFFLSLLLVLSWLLKTEYWKDVH
jgi:ubiquinol-cytochrome c reductase cytochrome c1 subunit